MLKHNVKIVCWLIALIGAISLIGCSSTKHVPEGEYLVDKVDIKINDNQDITSADLVNYLRQIPNHKVLGFWRMQLGTYNMSGTDTTKWFNRWARRMGQPPVIYDQALTDASVYQLTQSLVNKGYMDATVTVDTLLDSKHKKAEVTYNVFTGVPHYIATIDYHIPDSAIAAIFEANKSAVTIKPGDPLDRTHLDGERIRITELLRENGYYTFNKDYITFSADTAANSKAVYLTLNLRPPRSSSGEDIAWDKQVFYVRNVIFVTDYNPGEDIDHTIALRQDTVHYRGIEVLYGKDHYLRPKVLYDACFIKPGELYKASEINRTYEALSRFGILRYVNIDMRYVGARDSVQWLDAYVLLTRGKKQGVSFEVEGTNSEGDLGFGVGVTYQHRNLAHGSELLTTKFRTSYESLSGDLSGLINNRYMEYSGEVGITFPEFKAPFLSSAFKKRVRAATEFTVSFNYQERPEYTRIISGAGWKYRWANPSNTLRHRFDLLDINYVYLPKSTLDFIDQIAPSNPLLRYSYEDHFIMRIGYNYYRTNKRVMANASLKNSTFQPSVFTVRANIETAGNLLYGISRLIGQHRSDGAYKVFGIQYAQYVKGEADYSFIKNFDSRNALAFHAGAGIGVPYGNSSMIPFEKRFYAGGANSVRGWGVRTLGPGSYDARNSVTDFINQCGDIRLDLSVEYRAKIFWVFEGALFVDAGNIWTIRNYENQPGGMFKFSEFYKQLAASYGIGLRMDFTYFLLRFDLGMKAHNPARNQETWPLFHPKWSRDAAFHFSVGYPF